MVEELLHSALERAQKRVSPARFSRRFTRVRFRLCRSARCNVSTLRSTRYASHGVTHVAVMRAQPPWQSRRLRRRPQRVQLQAQARHGPLAAPTMWCLCWR
jgi:hypothetical protein